MMKTFGRMVRLENREFPQLALDNIKDPVGLTRALCNTLGAVRESKYNYPRSSQIGNICKREWVLGMLSEVKRKEFIHFPLLTVFRIGSGIHSYFQNSKSLFPNIIGNFKCSGCNKIVVFGRRPEGNCPFCGALNRAIRYSEYTFKISDPFYAVGKYDLILPIGNPERYRLGDIKGVADDKVEPRGNDILQMASYLLCAKYDEAMPIPIDTTVGYLFYISKKMSFKAPIRTIKVELTSQLEDMLLEIYMQIKRGVDEGLIPERVPNCKDKNCPFLGDCLSYGDRNDFAKIDSTEE